MGQVHDVPLEKFINNINPFKKPYGERDQGKS